MYGNHWKQGSERKGDLVNFRNNNLSAGFDGVQRVSEKQQAVEESPESIVALYVMYRSIVGDFFEHYQSGVGNPGGPVVDGVLLTISDLFAVYNAWQITRVVKSPKRIVEIGPGYGALAATLRRIYPETELVLVDLPEHRKVTEYYLRETVGLKNITITTELPDGADVMIALRCMMEMPESEVARYLDWAQSHDVGFLYVISRYIKQTVLKDYPFDRRWMPLISCVDYITGQIHELLLSRSEESDVLHNALQCLPPYVQDEFMITSRGSINVQRTSNELFPDAWAADISNYEH